MIPLISAATLREYRTVLCTPSLLANYPQLKGLQVSTAIEGLSYVADRYRITRRIFAFHRDPNDEHLIELDIVGRATHLISVDNDLLTLATAQSEAARDFRRRLPGIKIMKPHVFVEQFAEQLAL